MKKVERVCKIKFPVKGEFCLWEDLVGYVCTYKYNRVGVWVECWPIANCKCLLVPHTLITFSFYAWVWFRLDGLDMNAAFQEGKSSFAVWKGAVPQSPEISSSPFYLAVWLYLHLAKCCLWTWEQRNHLLSDFCCILTSKSLSVLCKFTALHYRNTWLYSPVFPNADNCQDWLIKK